MSVIPDLKALYEVDDSLWLEETIALLKERKFDALDLENLIEELEDLGGEKKIRVASSLEQVIIHALLLNFWTTEREYNQNHWETEILAFQTQLERHLTTNLKNFLIEKFPSIYKTALRLARRQTKNRVNFPDECPYSLENLLDPDWLPPYE
jgi:hypothetical protein